MPLTEPEPLPTSAPSSHTARAAVLVAPRRFEIRAVEIPEPAAGQVVIRLEGCGVCSSNIPVWEGRPWFNYPLEPGAPGHEGWGVVEAVGPGVPDLADGDRVATLSNGAYADYAVADAGTVLKLPESLRGRPFLGEPLGCAVNVFRRSDVRPGQTVVVVGIGFLGAILVRLAKNAGAQVVAISRRPFALDLARRFGADEVVPLGETWDTLAQARQLLGEAGCDRAIECTGLQEPLTLAGELVRVRGRLVIAGYHQDGPRQINLQSWNWRGIDVVNAHEREPAVYLEGMRLALDEVTSGRLDPTPLYTHTFPLDQLADALDHTARRPEGFLKALVRMDDGS